MLFRSSVLLDLARLQGLALVIVHVVDLFVNLNLCLGLQWVKEFLLLGVLFEFLDVAVETPAHPETDTQTHNRHLIHIHKVKGTLDCPHFFIIIQSLEIIES